jgi:TonB family protein
MSRGDDNDDGLVTVRAPRLAVAIALALALHLGAGGLSSLLPQPKRATERIELTLASTPRPPPSAAPAAAAPQKKTPARRRASTPPQTSPVLPELPADPEVARVELPLVERAPDPAPAPKPSWRDALADALASPRTPPMPSGELLPSLGTLGRVAFADPKLHDEETEQRLQRDHGAFFRRGLEALRSQWHPDEVLRHTEHDPARRCGRRDRTTFAVAVIDKKGNVVDVDLKNPSGCPDLDAEAVAAFMRVAVFPYPPPEIFIGPDDTPLDTARYPVRFIVTFDGGLQLDWRG